MATEYNPFPRSYQERYYAYQTTARGLLTEEQLTRSFEASALRYWHILKSYLPDDRNAVCLDVPCGYGNFLYFLRKYGYTNAQGFDLDPRQVALACSLGLDARLGDAFDVLAEVPAQPRLIAAIDFIEHVDKNAALRFLDTCHAALPEGGVLILRTPSADGLFGSHDICNDLTHEWGVTSNVLTAVLSMVGFRRVQILDDPAFTPNAGPMATLRWAVCGIAREVTGVGLKVLGVGRPKVWGRSMWAVAVK